MAERTKYYLAKGFGYAEPYPATEKIYEPLPDSYFENDLVRHAVELMVKEFIPKVDGNNIPIRNKSTGEFTLKRNATFYQPMARTIWEALVESRVSVFFQESKRTSDGLRYDGVSIFIEIHTDIEDDFIKTPQELIRENNSKKNTNIFGCFEELYHFWQFLHGEFWFEKRDGAWHPVSNLYIEAVAKKRAAAAYTKPKTQHITTNMIGFTVPSIQSWYKNADLKDIAEQLKKGITAKVKAIFDDGKKPPQEIEVDYPSGGYDFLDETSPASPIGAICIKNDRLFGYPFKISEL